MHVGKPTMQLALGVAAGAAYGLFLRSLTVFPHAPDRLVVVMSYAFLFVVPFAMGFITIRIAADSVRDRIWAWCVLPWVTVVLATIVAVALFWEGSICALMFLPIAAAASSLGGITAGMLMRVSRRPRTLIPVTIVGVLPFLLNAVEAQFLPASKLALTTTYIDIAAPPSTVWRNIERVPQINEQELQPAWTNKIGFPRPQEATLSYEGVGGVRHASFAGGVVFIETVDVWDPERRLSFSIHPDRIPRSTLDEHVSVGGEYFDVLRGEYLLEETPGGKTRLWLRSTHRLSTDFNWYGEIWVSAVMRDIQNSILQVIRLRCEKGAAVDAPQRGD